MKDLNLLLTTIAEGLKLLSKGIESIAETVDAFAEAQREEKPSPKGPTACDCDPACVCPSCNQCGDRESVRNDERDKTQVKHGWMNDHSGVTQ